jgi:hypothetical protein
MHVTCIVLFSSYYSIYHSAHFNLSRRFAKGFGFTISYNFSKSMDIGSIDPGSTTASGNPDQPNLDVLRRPAQKLVSFSLSKTTQLTERVGLEFRWDVFNAFNFANFANPNADLSDETDFGQITRSVGGPRTMQFGVKLKF